jgi:hypothetical protein
MSKRFTEMSEEEKKKYFLDRANKWKQDHPKETRDTNRINSRKTRKTTKWKEYYSNYFKVWRENPVNNACHSTRCTISALRSTLKRNPTSDIKESNIKLLENLQAVGWSVDMDTSKQVLNHIVSLYWLHTFKVDLSKDITCDPINLEICDKLNNNRRVKRTVNKKVLEVAKALESKFKELEGLYEFLKKHEGDIK